MQRVAAHATLLVVLASAGLPERAAAQGGRPRAGAGPVLSTAEIAARSTAATVTILAVDARGDTTGQGSGFIIRNDGVIVTNHHVLRGASTAVVILKSGERYDRVRVIDADAAGDLALLKIPAVDLPVVPTRNTIPAPGAKVVAIGNPLGLTNTVTEGIVSAVRVVDGRELVQMSAAISPGSSGGAVLDDRGRTFAIATAYLRGGQQLNFAVPVHYALGLLADAKGTRTVAEVFSSSGSAGAGESASQLARATVGREGLTGTFLVEHRLFGPDGRIRLTQGGILAVGRRIGLLQLTFPPTARDTSARSEVFTVDEFRTTADGQAVMDAATVVYEGYQTAGGGVSLAGALVMDGEKYRHELVARPWSASIASWEGLYTAQVRTSSGTGGTTDDWTGEIAVGMGRGDSLHIALYLQNTVGGTTGMYGKAPRSPDGSFTAVSSDGMKWLQGSLRAGVIKGAWVDQRVNGIVFTGHLRGERR